jgi:hypothetical protein
MGACRSTRRFSDFAIAVFQLLPVLLASLGKMVQYGKDEERESQYWFPTAHELEKERKKTNK